MTTLRRIATSLRSLISLLTLVKRLYEHIWGHGSVPTKTGQRKRGITSRFWQRSVVFSNRHSFSLDKARKLKFSE